MIIFPAVDIKDGKCVRLKQGVASETTVFADDPVEAALRWRDLGAKWLHLIDLDGAFAGKAVNLPMITRLCKEIQIPVQMGGGIRSLDIAKSYIEAGVTRLIIGTMALEDPDTYEEMCKTFPGRIGVSLDTSAGKLKTKGWVADSGLTIADVLPRLEKQGTAFIIHTDIDRDGMQSGLNLEMLTELGQSSQVPVIAAGGLATMADVKALYPVCKQYNVQGAITGRAIYEGTLDLGEAMSWIAAQEKLN